MMMNEERTEAVLNSGLGLDLWVEDGCPLGKQHRQQSAEPAGGQGTYDSP